jgi:VWFA-related protein
VASLHGDPSTLAGEQQPAATFRSSIEAVQIDVFVADAAGNPVSGLTVDDFELIENGTPQPITTFEAVHIPIERSEPLEGLQVDSDVLTNDRPQGRVYVFAVDEVEPCNAVRTRRFLRDFLDRFFGPNDIGAVVLTGRGLTTDGQGFTSSRRLLLEAVEKLSGRAPEFEVKDTCEGRYEPKDARTGGTERTGRTPGPGPAGRSQQVASLRDLIESIARIPGRHKAMLFFAEGIEVDMQDIVDYNGGVLSIAGDDAHAAMMAATRTNLRIYPIDPTGLAPTLTGGLTAGLAQQRFDSMHALASATGGFALANSNSFAETFERIVRDNSTYYMLGFNSGYDRADGRYVRVQVRAKRPGLTVHAREGYVARTREEQLARERVQSSPTPLEAALGNPLTASGVPMRVFATPFRGSGKNATVMLTVEIDARSLELTAGNGVYSGTLDLRYVATDAKLKVYPEVRHNATVQIKAASSGPGGAQSSGPPVVPPDLRARVATMLELPEGRYQLRVAAATAGRTGNVVYDLEVPDFTEQPLMMSGLAVYTTSEARVLTLRPTGSAPGKPMTCRRSPCVAPLSASPSTQVGANSGPAGPAGSSLGTPTGAREFAASEPVVLAAEVYDNTKRRAKDPRPAITLTTDLRDTNGAVIPLTSEERGASSEQGASDRYPYEVRLPLQKVPRGAYVLRVQARSAADQERVVVREIPIRVR